MMDLETLQKQMQSEGQTVVLVVVETVFKILSKNVMMETV